MKTFKVKIDLEYEIECADEDDVLNELEEKLGEENTTPENEFWDNCKVTEIEQ